MSEKYKKMQLSKSSDCIVCGKDYSSILEIANPDAGPYSNGFYLRICKGCLLKAVSFFGTVKGDPFTPIAVLRTIIHNTCPACGKQEEHHLASYTNQWEYTQNLCSKCKREGKVQPVEPTVKEYSKRLFEAVFKTKE